MLHEIRMAETRADAERGFEHLADVVRGVKLVDGVRQEKQNLTKPRLPQVAA